LFIPPVAADLDLSGSVGPPWLHLPSLIDVGSSVHEKNIFQKPSIKAVNM
jgi:hypothetical protein